MSGNGQTQLLPESDREFLDEKGYVYDVQQAGDVFVTIRDFILPEASGHNARNLLLFGRRGRGPGPIVAGRMVDRKVVCGTVPYTGGRWY